MIVYEPASTKAREAQEVPVIDLIATEDIGPQDNVEDDEVLPQIEHNVVSSPVLTNNELISIGRPLTQLLRMTHGLITHKNPPVKKKHQLLPQLKSPLW